MRCHVYKKLSNSDPFPVTLVCDLEHEHLEELHHDVFFGLWWKEDDSAESNVVRIPLSPPPKTEKYVYDGPLFPTHMPELVLTA